MTMTTINVFASEENPVALLPKEVRNHMLSHMLSAGNPGAVIACFKACAISA